MSGILDGMVNLRDHLLSILAQMDLRYQQRFDAQQQALQAALLSAEKAVQTAMIAAEKAVDKANTANEKRFESVNEFRQALTDQTSSFPSRAELKAVEQRVSDLATRMERSEGRSTGLSAGWSIFLAIAGLVGVAIAVVSRLG